MRRSDNCTTVDGLPAPPDKFPVNDTQEPGSCLGQTDSAFADRLDALTAPVAAYLSSANHATRERLLRDGQPDKQLADERQRELHGLAWIGCTAQAIRRVAQWGLCLVQASRLREAERLVLATGIGEYLEQLTGGIAMSQNEIFRPGELGLQRAAQVLREDVAVAWFLQRGNTAANRRQLIAAVRAGVRPDESLGDPELDMVRESFRRFSAERIAPHAQRWHLADVLIPDSIIADMAALGAFGICIVPEYGGLGLGELAMCVVTEELSRAWIAAGSLGTRSATVALPYAPARTRYAATTGLWPGRWAGRFHRINGRTIHEKRRQDAPRTLHRAPGRAARLY